MIVDTAVRGSSYKRYLGRAPVAQRLQHFEAFDSAANERHATVDSDQFRRSDWLLGIRDMPAARKTCFLEVVKLIFVPIARNAHMSRRDAIAKEMRDAVDCSLDRHFYRVDKANFDAL
ncbi:hypothetical protein M3A49_27540 [Paraburkholderia sp. CNPSo 3076]|uniref:hypothetical protein n=1 Tax=Paraburkholderia sp. CNPSo 3076 TaxID=2940936 RepID=UPI002250D35E|nr:hypothetical protein [Paraburkholderia sp. CNPSo 3076]MCX5543197.1 hypothetical protein [Paraburkholderia sp. CNPSo 3076]